MWKCGKGEIYYNILDFYFDTDYKNFQKFILIPVIKKYIQKYKEVEENLRKHGFQVGDDWIDMEATAQLFFKYKIVRIDRIVKEKATFEQKIEYILFQKELDEKLKQFKTNQEIDTIANVVTSNNMLAYFGKNNINRKMVKLFVEKNVDIVRKGNPVRAELGQECEALFGNLQNKVEVEGIEILLQQVAYGDERIDLLYCIFFEGNYLCYEKCKIALEKMQEEVSREEENSKDKFLCLSTD